MLCKRERKYRLYGFFEPTVSVGQQCSGISKPTNVNVNIYKEYYAVCVIWYGRGFSSVDEKVCLCVLRQLEIMLEAQVWREAATQVFFALGLGFGGVIAFSSYNKRNNNCHFDAVLVSFINFFTSVLATLVVFAVLGFKANIMIDKCVELWVHNPTE